MVWVMPLLAITCSVTPSVLHGPPGLAADSGKYKISVAEMTSVYVSVRHPQVGSIWGMGNPVTNGTLGSRFRAYSSRLTMPSLSGSAKSPLMAELLALVPNSARRQTLNGVSWMVTVAVTGVPRLYVAEADKVRTTVLSPSTRLSSSGTIGIALEVIPAGMTIELVRAL